METRILEIAVAKLSDEMEELKKQFVTITAQLTQCLKSQSEGFQTPSKAMVEEDVLMDFKEVQNKLGICYTSLSKLIKQGFIKPIRINQRRVRFSKASIIRYIQSQIWEVSRKKKGQ